MKKIFLILTGIGMSGSLLAQEPADALRYSWYSSSGTARQQAIGGAMASLGGDLSAVFVNPAGLGFYKTGDVVLTPGFSFLRNKSTYLGRTENDKKNMGSYGASGVVLGGQTDKKRSGVAVAFGFNRTAAFGNNILYRGINNQSSYSQKFLEEISTNNDKDANNVASNYPFGTSLAFNTYWIDTVAGGSANNFQFKTRAPIGTGLIQENAINNHGAITELALAFAANSKDKYFYGLTLGIPLLTYNREATYTEADATDNSTNNFDFASITENLRTSGAGINLKLGFIYKPKEFIRLGIAVHTPTLYQLTDRYSSAVTTNTESYKGQLEQTSGFLTNTDEARFNYWMISPYRVMVSASYVLREIQDVRKQKGFLTADIEYVNYKASSFTTDPEGDNSPGTKSYLKSLNKTIDNTYKGAFNFKVGGELKFTTIMARLGAAYYGNPYKKLAHEEKGSRIQLSGGLGYRNKGVFVDLTYVHSIIKDIHFAYRLQNSPFYKTDIRTTGGNVLLTVGFKI